MDELHNTLQQLVAKRSIEGQQRWVEASKRRLLKIIETKCKTSFIGALSQFEQFFGKLWGHGEDEDKITQDQLVWREIWNECRTAVLNNGNNQIRAVQNEFQQYDINWNRHERQLPVILVGGNHEREEA